jgi:outer membrane biosynthesis protein TonB
MSDVVKDPSLSVAYQALERRREEVIAARDRIAAELRKLDAALEALQTLAENAPEAAKADGQESAPSAAEAVEASAKAAPKPAAASKPAAAPKPAAASKPAAAPKPAAASKPAAAPKPAAASKPAAAPNPAAEAKPAGESGRAADRKARVVEFLLENPRQWFTSSEIAVLTEGENISGTQRNAVSETLRRLLRRKAVQRDDKSRPVKYRAVPAALRELLLAAQ